MNIPALDINYVLPDQRGRVYDPGVRYRREAAACPCNGCWRRERCAGPCRAFEKYAGREAKRCV